MWRGGLTKRRQRTDNTDITVSVETKNAQALPSVGEKGFCLPTPGGGGQSSNSVILRSTRGDEPTRSWEGVANSKKTQPGSILKAQTGSSAT